MAEKVQETNRSEFLRPKGLAEELQVHISTVWRWVHEGRLPKPVKFAPRCSLFNRREVMAAVAKMGRAA